MTRSDDIRHPPEICWTDGAWLRCGMSSRANHATSASEEDNLSAHACFRLFLRIKNVLTTATTSTIAPISHHNHAGVELVSLEVGVTASVWAAVGVGVGVAG